jgi:hypothetical protein
VPASGAPPFETVADFSDCNRSGKITGTCSGNGNAEKIEWLKAGSPLNILKKQTVSVYSS